jgi:EAL domain-containing protein (putative c-di-GMP-specific phosphodiesterase class I)/ActR/RegA family two-component response regulator
MDEVTQQTLRVLVVDDDAVCARTVAGMLRHVGPHAVETAASADEAVERLNASTFDLIFCDLNMPGRDGVETMRLFAERHIKCPILLVSGADHKILKAAQELGKHRGLGVAGTLHKPFGLEQIKGALAHVAQVTSPRSRRPLPIIPTAELAEGIAMQQLVLHYQPQLNLHTCQLEGTEALVRWQHPERGMLMPDSFITLAESSGLIAPLTEWVVREAIRQAALWRRNGLDIGVSVNLSAQTLRELDLPDRIAATTAAAGLNPGRITLEITESGMTDDIDSLLDITTRLRLKGFLLAIDDFGTGFSSLTQLKRLPFTELKLDRTFVSGAAADGDSRSLLESSVNLAKRLQLKTVAEGIETEEEWNLLVWMGVDLGQGYHMARPMAADKILPWYTGWQAQVA